MRKLYVWNTPRGPIFIAEHRGRYFVLFDDENLGGWATAEQAAIAAAGGECDRVGPGIDTAKLGISEDLNEWHRVAEPR